MVMPENSWPLALMDAVVGSEEAMVVMAESCQPLMRYFAAADWLLVRVGSQTKLTTARWRWSAPELPLSTPQPL